MKPTTASSSGDREASRGGGPSRRPRPRPRTEAFATALLLLAWASFSPLAAQVAHGGAAGSSHAAALRGHVIDEEGGAPLAEAAVVLRALEPAGPDAAVGKATGSGPAGLDRAPRRATTGADGAWDFGRLPRGRYALTVERFGYRRATLEVTLERAEPLVLTVRLRPVPFRLGRLDSWIRATRGPTLVAPAPHGPAAPRGGPTGRADAVRGRQLRFLAPDVRQLGHADLREANTLAEDDVFRALQRLPGVGSRDDFGADLWTRGAPAGQTAVRFDGIPLLGGLHALGVLGGLNSDMLATATFRPGVAGAALQGAGAGVVDVTSRSRADGDGGAAATLSPLSARVAVDGQWSERVGWAVGLRRSYLDALSRVAGGVGPGDGRMPYAFTDATGRLDVALGSASRLEASAFWQDDRVFGDVPGLAYGNEGSWGSLLARASLVTAFGGAVARHTLGVSDFGASVGASPSSSGGHAPLHPPTENHYRTLVWESRLDRGPGRGGGEPGPNDEEPGRSDGGPGGSNGAAGPVAVWSLGLRATREDHRYNGPGIDLARLLSPEELARRGIGDLTPVIAGLQRAHLLHSRHMTRLALWGERRRRLGGGVEMEGGLRLETGDRVADGQVRLAPRLRLRYRPAGSPFSVAAAWGRAYQYVQSVARTDVLRPGLRASEVLAQAGSDTPALRSDVVTLGGEAWSGSSWLFGATLWWRGSSGILLPEPTPGVIDGTRPAVPATGRALGLELSARKLEGPVRGFANYSLSRARHRVGSREFAASEDRRHVANLGVVADVRPPWRVGATVRAQSGAPYTRITLVPGECEDDAGCDGTAPVLYGAPGGQRAPAYLGVDLMTEWSHGFDDWTLSVYGQLRNALGRANAITYHSSCICAGGGDPSRASLRDRFDRGLPRLPVLGVRARFR